ncbi:alpha/beta hydrolase [Pararobbsia silviterrae]|uniref:Alpha/beta hydrolase n=1 Tax=Pararobbsia silviterrae TaxID=1792498 RepID=A0A494Y1Q1_9BURK|nr:alpha/beta hydrolase [Pararobbsia silviterrae]RKP53795.1 alpha/beta hydrolase [Pararobbsia silviterrae]
MLTDIALSHDETLRRLDDGERAAEHAVLAAVDAHFAGFKGSLRAAYDAMTAATPIADDVSLERIDADGVQGWWVRPAGARADRVMLFVHGGAFMLGSAEAYRGFASQIATRTRIDTFVLDYPLAPEHPFPAAYDATIAALAWLAKSGTRDIALAGDSAGGGLVLAALGHDVELASRVTCVAAFSPWVDLALAGASFLDEQTYDPIFKPVMLSNAASAYLGSHDARDRRASPLYAIPERLPPILFQVGSDELLIDDARRYAHAAAQRGTPVQLDIFEGLHHVFQRSTVELPSARFALDRLAAFVEQHG